MASRRDDEYIYAQNWRELTDGLAQFPGGFSNNSSPRTIMLELNKLLHDNQKYQREASIERNCVQIREKQIAHCHALQRKCYELEEENLRLRTSTTTTSQCDNCKVLRGQINTLEHEKAQYEIELSSRKEALLALQNSLQESSEQTHDYPDQSEDELLQVKAHNSILKEQLAKCHRLTVEMQNNYLHPEHSEELKKLHEKCQRLEEECTSLRHVNEQLNVQIDTIQTEKRRLDNRIHSDLCQEISPSDGRFTYNEVPQATCQQPIYGNMRNDGLRAGKVSNTSNVSSSSLELEPSFRYGNLEKENQELRSKVQELKEIISKTDVAINMLSGANATGVPNADEFTAYDRTVVIKQKDSRKTYGVYIDQRQSPITKAESKFFIANINNKDAEQSGLKVGQHVIEVNGTNIQQASKNKVKHLIESGDYHDLKLVVRPPNREYNFKSISGLKPKECQDWGVTFGIFIKEIDSSSFTKKQFGLHEFDEVLKVNNQPVKELSINNIHNLMKKFVHLEIQRLKEDLFIVPDTVYNSIHRAHLPSTDEYFVESEEALYVSKEYSMSTPNIATQQRPVQTEGHHLSFSTNTLLNNGSTLSPSRFVSPANVVTISMDGFKLSFLKLVGGNSVGIYIGEETDVGIEKGWRLLRINTYNLEKVALGFAYDMVAFLAQEDDVTVMLEKTHVEDYEAQMKKVPHDGFYIKTIANCKKGSGFLFKSNETYCVNNSHYVDEDGEDDNDRTFKWKATRSGPNGNQMQKIIPKQEPNILIIQREPEYDWKKKMKKNPNVYYVILDEDVDITYSDADDHLLNF